MSEELKPCPFCGGEADIWRAHEENPRRKAWVACMAGCVVLTREYPTDAEVIAAWNTRAPLVANHIDTLEGEEQGVLKSQPCGDGSPPILPPGAEPSAWIGSHPARKGDHRLTMSTEALAEWRQKGWVMRPLYEAAAIVNSHGFSAHPGESPSVPQDEPALEGEGWQTMETGPKDGTWVDLWAYGRRYADMFWDDKWSAWGRKEVRGRHAITSIKTDLSPTHWRPLPAPPVSAPPVSGEGGDSSSVAMSGGTASPKSESALDLEGRRS